MTAIEYLENRIAVLRREEPATPSGREALERTIHELQNIIFAFRLEALHNLHDAIAESLSNIKPEIRH